MSRRWTILVCVIAIGAGMLGLVSAAATSPTKKAVARATVPVLNYACYNAAGAIESTRQGLTVPTCAHPTDAIRSWTTDAYVKPSPSTTTSRPPTTTTANPSTSAVPTTATTTTTAPAGTCVGTAMNSGQADINAAPAGTTFCLSGVHNGWTLTPKSGDKLIGPATLNGTNSTTYAIEAGSATNVTVAYLEIENYTPGDQQGAIHVANLTGATGWMLLNDLVHDNGTPAGGSGANLGNGWAVIGGRYYNNRQEGLGGQVGDNVTVNSVQIDHNNFTDDSYTTRNISCGYEAGGFKWVSNGVTVEDSTISDNACKGLWADLNGDNATIKNNVVSGNWDEGIFIEISSGATITGNTVTDNGLHNYNGSPANACNSGVWLFAGGITLAASDHATISNNTLAGNCRSLTGVQQSRPDGHPGLLEDDTWSNNTVASGGESGVATDDGANLAAANLVFTGNTFGAGVAFCDLSC